MRQTRGSGLVAVCVEAPPTLGAEGQDQQAYDGQQWRHSEETDAGPAQLEDTIDQPTEEVSEVETTREAEHPEVLEEWPGLEAERLEPLHGCQPTQHGRNDVESAEVQGQLPRPGWKGQCQRRRKLWCAIGCPNSSKCGSVPSTQQVDWRWGVCVVEETCSQHTLESEHVQSPPHNTVSNLPHEIHLDESQAKEVVQKTEAEKAVVSHTVVQLESGRRHAEAPSTEL